MISLTWVLYTFPKGLLVVVIIMELLSLMSFDSLNFTELLSLISLGVVMNLHGRWWCKLSPRVSHRNVAQSRYPQSHWVLSQILHWPRWCKLPPKVSQQNVAQSRCPWSHWVSSRIFHWPWWCKLSPRVSQQNVAQCRWPRSHWVLSRTYIDHADICKLSHRVSQWNVAQSRCPCCRRWGCGCPSNWPGAMTTPVTATMRPCLWTRCGKSHLSWSVVWLHPNIILAWTCENVAQMVVINTWWTAYSLNPIRM